MRPDPQEYADVLVLAIKSALAPLQAQLQAQRDEITDLKTRLSDDTLPRELGGLRERVAVIEARPPVPGPPGEPGPAGKDGEPGTPGLAFQGVYQDGKQYEVGHLVTWAGSSWHCNDATTTKPGDGSKAWTLMVKRGRDGKDAT